MKSIDLSDVPRTPRLDEYFGLWAMFDATFLAMFDRAAGIDLRGHVLRTASPQVESYLMRTPIKSGAPAKAPVGGAAEQDQPYIAVIAVTGSLMKQVGSLEDGSSTIRLRRDIRAAAGDSNAVGILMLVDSPGGTVSGTSDLAAEVAAAAGKKPVYAFVEDLCASAAYWVASGATQIFANAGTALVGSIGTYAGLYDLSGMAGQQGIKAKLYKTGPLKGAGFPGTEITAAQDAAFQAMVDETQTHFAAAVAANRKLSAAQMKAVTTGGVWLASEAQRLGLIDGVKTFDETLAALEAAANKTNSTGAGSGARRADDTVQLQQEDLMDPVTPAPGATTAQGAAPKPANLTELKAAFPKANAEFREFCQEKAFTLDQAKDAWIARQDADLETAQAATKTVGTKPIGGGAPVAKASEAGAADFSQLVTDKLQAKPSLTRHQAIAAVARENPESHAAYVAGLPKAKPPVNPRAAAAGK